MARSIPGGSQIQQQFATMRRVRRFLEFECVAEMLGSFIEGHQLDRFLPCLLCVGEGFRSTASLRGTSEVVSEAENRGRSCTGLEGFSQLLMNRGPGSRTLIGIEGLSHECMDEAVVVRGCLANHPGLRSRLQSFGDF